LKFTEEQSYNQPWLIAISIFPVLVLMVGIIYQVGLGKSFGSNPVPDSTLYLLLFTMSLPAIVLRIIKLKTEITKKEIHFGFHPFHSKSVSWEEVLSARVIKYGFVGGYGIRMFTKHGTVYNVRGKMGLAIELKTGKKLIIGTQDPDRLKTYLKRIEKPYPH